jgi:hypothetical protein
MSQRHIDAGARVILHDIPSMWLLDYLRDVHDTTPGKRVLDRLASCAISAWIVAPDDWTPRRADALRSMGVYVGVNPDKDPAWIEMRPRVRRCTVRVMLDWMQHAGCAFGLFNGFLEANDPEDARFPTLNLAGSCGTYIFGSPSVEDIVPQLFANALDAHFGFAVSLPERLVDLDPRTAPATIDLPTAIMKTPLLACFPVFDGETWAFIVGDSDTPRCRSHDALLTSISE